MIPTYPRHPWVMAQQALTTQAAIGNRLALGIGLSHQVVIEGMWGMSFAKPILHLREYLEVLVPLSKGEAVVGAGHHRHRTRRASTSPAPRRSRSSSPPSARRC